MMNSSLHSPRLLDNAVKELAGLPGIGQKTALRLALFILKQETEAVYRLTSALSELKEKVKYCSICHNISDNEKCLVCSDPKRDHGKICVVESIRDVLAIEKTQQFSGIYHVLGGVISPMDGIAPSDLNIATLSDKARAGNISEIIFALSATMEGDTTCFYIFRKLSDCPVKFTTIARGIPVGDELEYADEVTLGRSLMNRVPFEKVM